MRTPLISSPSRFRLGHRVISIALASVSLCACKKETEPPPEVRPVRSIVVKKREVGDPIIVTGNVRARDEVNLAFRISGRLIERSVDVGDTVRTGQTVARLDSEVEQNTRNSAKAEHAAAKAAYEQAAAFERRQKQLLNERVISPTEYDLSLREMKTTRARMEAAAAQLRSAEEQLSYTELKAEASGVITQKGAEPGEVVQPGSMVLKLAQESGRDAVFNLPAQVIREGLSVGQPVEVWLADNPQIKTSGEIREISPEADPVTRNYQVKVELADVPAGMLLGTTVVGRIMFKSKPLIAIPSTALTKAENKPAVWVVDSGNQRVHRRPIAIARHAPDSVIVKDGLKTGERVATAGVQELHEGQAVSLLEGNE